jgi:hypothetical protein
MKSSAIRSPGAISRFVHTLSKIGENRLTDNRSTPPNDRSRGFEPLGGLDAESDLLVYSPISITLRSASFSIDFVAQIASNYDVSRSIMHHDTGVCWRK